MTTYKLVPLLKMREQLVAENPNAYPPKNEEIEKCLRPFYIVLRIETAWHTEFTDQKQVAIIRVGPENMMLHTEHKKFGISNFKIESDLTPESESEDIEKAITKFHALFYKERSRLMYKQAADINLTTYAEPFGSVEIETVK